MKKKREIDWRGKRNKIKKTGGKKKKNEWLRDKTRKEKQR